MPTDNDIKILFRFYSDILDAETVETLPAQIHIKEVNYYKITSIPFYAPDTALGDIVWAEFSPKEETLTYRKTIEHSGNSVIHPYVTNTEYNIDTICGLFTEIDCQPAKMNNKYFALQIPAAIDYLPIKSRLDELENNGVIGYAETCLSDKHQYKNYSPF
jgi:hypothetical protein